MTKAAKVAQFRPTPEMVSIATSLFKAMAWRETVKPIVDGYQRRILAEGQWKIRPEFAERLGSGVITDPKKDYLMSEQDFQEYFGRQKTARDAAGLVVENDEHCPLLVAENMIIQLENALIDQMEPVTKLNREQLSLLENRKKFLDLTLRLLAPFVDVDLEKSAKCTNEEGISMGSARAESSFENRLGGIRSEWEHAVGESDESRNFLDWLSAEHPAIVPVVYTSSWEEGNVETSAILDLETGEVADIGVSDQGAEYEHLIKEFIEVAGGIVQAQVELLPDDTTRVISKDDLESLRAHFASPQRGPQR